MIAKGVLEQLYIREKRSMQEIADRFGYSLHKVAYWMERHKIKRRSRSDAAYTKHNPDGDPFLFVSPKSRKDFELWGMGLGLYWGEGNKANKNTVKLGNSDPALMRVFVRFLGRFFQINKKSLRFHLHTFSDVDINTAKQYWRKELGLSDSQFYKPTITISGSLGTYREKSEFGVLTLYYGNVRVRDILVNSLPR